MLERDEITTVFYDADHFPCSRVFGLGKFITGLQGHHFAEIEGDFIFAGHVENGIPVALEFRLTVLKGRSSGRCHGGV